MTYDLRKLNEKFFTDPDWPELENVIKEYLAPFKDVMNIKSDLSNDEIASEVRGRQMMIEQLERFLSDTGVVRSKINKPNNIYK